MAVEKAKCRVVESRRSSRRSSGRAHEKLASKNIHIYIYISASYQLYTSCVRSVNDPMQFSYAWNRWLLRTSASRTPRLLGENRMSGFPETASTVQTRLRLRRPLLRLEGDNPRTCGVYQGTCSKTTLMPSPEVIWTVACSFWKGP